jgi:hypothetical protein
MARLIANRITNNLGGGLGLRNQSVSAPAAIKIQRNAVISNQTAGIALQDMQAAQSVEISENLVKGTELNQAAPGGDGIQICEAQGTGYNVTIRQNDVEESQRNGIFLQGVGGVIDGNIIINSGMYALFCQLCGTVTGSNTYLGNSSGNFHSVTTLVEQCGVLPLPMP